MYIRSCLVALGIALATLSFPVKRDATAVESDLATIDGQTNSLYTAIDDFPNSGGTLVQVISIAEQANQLDNVIKSSTGDAGTTTFSDADGSAVVVKLTTLAEDTQKTLDALMSKKAAISSISEAEPITLEQLQTLQGDSNTYLTDVSAVMPAGSKGSAEEQITLIYNAFSSAITAFSS